MLEMFRHYPLTSLISRRFLSLNTRPKSSNPFKAGQPTHETRPHYIPSAGNLTPGITALEYYERRLRLSQKLPEKSIAVLVGNQVQFASGAVFHPFQQNTDLYYLTGWLEPNSVAIIEKNPTLTEDGGVALHMLVPPNDPRTELWEGSKLGVDGACEIFNADYAEPIDNARAYIDSLLKRNDHLFYDKEAQSGMSKFFGDFFGSKSGNKGSIVQSIEDLAKRSNVPVEPLTPLVSNMRLVKSINEIDVMHAAANISSRAINQCIAKVGSSMPFVTEKTMAKYLDYMFVRGGCDSQAYIPVVASGRNALTIHYTRNDDLLYRDETVFVDAGGKLGGYCADISRSWPNGPQGFSDAQRDIYEVVLNTNKLCIDLCDASKQISLHDIHTHSVQFMHQELKNLPGFSALTRQQVSTFLYPHYIGHYLGLDLHDVPLELTQKPLAANTVLTIEPGVYIPDNDRWPKAFRGIGVRVEDDIVVGHSSNDILNLTSGCVKEVADIEALIRSGLTSTPGLDDELVVLDI